MNRFLALCLGVLAFGGSLTAQSNYCVWNEAAISRGGTDRVVRSISVTGATLNRVPQSFELPVAGNTAIRQTQIYFDKTSQVLQATVGDEIVLNVNKHSLEWMHFYFYIDLNQDGQFTESEVVSYSVYGPGDANYRDSKGVSRANNYVPNSLPSYIIPASTQTGTTRARFKVDWNSLDPCGRGNLATNRGTMVDFTININPAPALAQQVSFAYTFDNTQGNVAVTKADGSAVASGSNVDSGSTLRLAITPNEGKTIESVLVNGLERKADVSQGILTLTVSEATNVSVVFGTRQLDVTYSFTEDQVTFQMHKMQGDVVGDLVTSASQVPFGQSVRLTINPKEGYQIDAIKINGVDRKADFFAGVLRLALRESTTIEVVSSRITAFEVSYTYDDEMGTVSVIKVADNSPVASDTMLEAGTQIKLIAAPQTGYVLGTIIVNGVERTNDVNNGELLLTVESPGLEIHIEFEPQDYEIKVSVNDATMGRVSVYNAMNEELNASDMVFFGEGITIAAVPAADHQLESLKVNDVEVSNRVVNNRVSVMVDEQGINIVARFKKTTSISLAEQTSIKIYTSGRSVVIEGAEANSSVRVYSLSGKLVAQAVAEGTTTLPLVEGTYVVRVGDVVAKVSIR